MGVRANRRVLEKRNSLKGERKTVWNINIVISFWLFEVNSKLPKTRRSTALVRRREVEWKKVGKYEKILSCIDRSKYAIGEPRVFYDAFLHGESKRKKEYANRGFRRSLHSLFLFIHRFRFVNNSLLHASLPVMLSRLFDLALLTLYRGCV